MLPLGLIIVIVLVATGVPVWTAECFIVAWFALWLVWTWLKVWAVNRTEN